MAWVSYILQALGGIGLVSLLSTTIARYLVDRRLQQDRIRYETQMQTLLQDLRTRCEKDIFIHHLQFEKEFTIYLDLWKEALALGRAAAEFRECKESTGKSPEQERQDYIQDYIEAHNLFQQRVYDYRPFYAPEVYELAKNMLNRSAKVYRFQTIPQNSKQIPWEKTEALLDQINETIDPLCNAIRHRIWSEIPNVA